MDKIGEGTFTKAYRKSATEVLLISCDPIKECMAHGWFPKSHLFPKIDFHENHIDQFVMRYYPRVTSLKNNLKSDHYEFYKDLRRVMDLTGLSTMGKMRAIKCRRKRQIMIEALEACMAYGETKFEISPRNVAVSPTGGLILLDCFFLPDKLEEVRNRNKQR